jgi:hypothetical protein
VISILFLPCQVGEWHRVTTQAPRVQRCASATSLLTLRLLLHRRFATEDAKTAREPGRAAFGMNCVVPVPFIACAKTIAAWQCSAFHSSVLSCLTSAARCGDIGVAIASCWSRRVACSCRGCDIRIGRGRDNRAPTQAAAWPGAAAIAARGENRLQSGRDRVGIQPAPRKRRETRSCAHAV